MNKAAVLVIRMISFFFRSIGGRACRFHPSCSAYGAEAFAAHGFLRAAGLTLGRVLRCQPLSAGGYDPVPGVSWKKERS